MKKIITSLFLLFALFSQSQNEKKFGVFSGVINSAFTKGIAEDINGGSYVTPHIGVFYEFKLKEKVHFLPKLMYSQLGNRDDISAFSSGFEAGYKNYRVDYINMPLDFKFWNKTYLTFGPEISFLINSNSKYTNESPKSSVDFGLNIAFGQRFRNVFLELGTYQGFVPVIDYSFYGKNIDLNNAYARFTIGCYIL